MGIIVFMINLLYSGWAVIASGVLLIGLICYLGNRLDKLVYCDFEKSLKFTIFAVGFATILFVIQTCSLASCYENLDLTKVPVSMEFLRNLRKTHE